MSFLRNSSSFYKFQATNMPFLTELKSFQTASKWLKGEVFKHLKNKLIFGSFFVDGQIIALCNDADIAPETLYLESEPVLSCNRP